MNEVVGEAIQEALENGELEIAQVRGLDIIQPLG